MGEGMNFFKKISGKTVEEKIEEYSEVYGEILLGLHKESEKQNTLLEKHEQQFNSQEENLHEQVQLKSQVKNLQGQVKHLGIFCVLSYIFAIGVGVVIWMIS